MTRDITVGCKVSIEAYVDRIIERTWELHCLTGEDGDEKRYWVWCNASSAKVVEREMRHVPKVGEYVVHRIGGTVARVLSVDEESRSLWAKASIYATPVTLSFGDILDMTG